MSQFSNKFDLEERTAKFGEEIISLCKSIFQDTVTKPIISQLVRSGTSVGANYMEANGASSRKDFRNKIFICKKEVQETKHWLRMISQCVADKNPVKELWREAQELTMIFQKVSSSLDKNKK
ncbi:MAG: four helix bundle protein [Patescibacteria group bacterium]